MHHYYFKIQSYGDKTVNFFKNMPFYITVHGSHNMVKGYGISSNKSATKLWSTL